MTRFQTPLHTVSFNQSRIKLQCIVSITITASILALHAWNVNRTQV